MHWHCASKLQWESRIYCNYGLTEEVGIPVGTCVGPTLCILCCVYSNVAIL
jgi:hypothetical protein